MEVPEHKEIRELARRFLSERGGALRAYEEEEAFPWPLVEEMAELGFLGVFVPEALGGAGLDFFAYLALLEEMGGWASLRSVLSVQQSLVLTPLLAYGTEAQKARYVPRLARREILGAFALTEPEAGSDAASLKTRAHREGDFYVLEGQKTFISHANVAEVFLVFAKTDPEKGAKGITCFLVERGDGVKTSPLKGKLGLRAADTGMVFLDGVRVPKDRVLGKEGEGFRIALSTLDTGRISLAAGAVGLMQRALDLSLAYTRERKQFGKPIAQFQLVQEHLAAMKLDLEAARLLTYRAAWKKVKGEPYTLEASLAKLFASEAANRVAYRAIQVHGGYGFFEEYEVARLYRDARILTLYEGTSEVQKLIIGAHLTGVRAFA
ncbi:MULTISPECIES: acyl-CoA dehydrogenase family protein [Thermus]|uniref:Acyl-CoA dehydrogenase n=2 Tax=Thermus thermophilus TaxID=274 RepID=Q53WE0_THET8|nr:MULTISPECIES: acyl-CoA dehydrogenase family protein [Thermus]QZY59519.1 acyl-CoA dehydrogenase family protein [Thermus thermophilus]BAD71818.1 putative acyl-CoA dehydrogenase [Thermus thermophilus HB8]BCP98027.1 acyl-CoA dehydrogenase [Thermus thermophilus]BCQ00357.1 acyl-CoA dehydrogenase [Thermus thermophilus]BDA38705.1 acyl-CoA dehydrogenase [Thermus thermophilus]